MTQSIHLDAAVVRPSALSDKVRGRLAEASIFLDKHHRGRHLAARSTGGGFTRVANGAYAAAAAPLAESWRERRRSSFTLIKAAVATMPPDAVIGYEYAALLYGAPVRRTPREVGVITPHKSSSANKPLGRRRHTRLLRPEHLVTLDGIAVTSPIRTAVDCARNCELVEALAIVDYFLRFLSQPDQFDRQPSEARIDAARRELLAVIDAEAGYRFNRRARAVIDIADGWAQSRLESEARRFCLALGLPRPTLQYWVGTRRADYFTDLAWEFTTVRGTVVSHLDVDGDLKYRGVEDVRKEKDREAEIRALGHNLARADTGLLGPRSLPSFQRRVAQLVPRAVQLALVPDPAFMTPWERANLVVSWSDPTLPCGDR